jgi:hypothetical protein
MNPTAATAQAHHGAGPTEIAAARTARKFSGTLRGRVLAAGDMGLTALEVTHTLGYGIEKLYSCAPRLPELEREGYVRKGATRNDRVSYVATDAGLTWAETAGVAA